MKCEAGGRDPPLYGKMQRKLSREENRQQGIWSNFVIKSAIAGKCIGFEVRA